MSKTSTLFTSAIFFILILTTHSKVEAQCTPLSSSYWGEMLPNAGCGTFASYSPFGPGQYFRMPVLQGASYTISTCGATINTQVTGFQEGNTSSPVFYNDDNGPVCGGQQASISYIPTFSNYLNVNVSEFNCLPGGSSSITVNVRQNNNLSFTSSGADMCQGEVRTLAAVPAPVSIAVPAGSGNTGTFSGSGVSGNTFTAPTPSGASGVYTITYSFGYCNTTQNITVWHSPSAADAGTNMITCDTLATLSGNTPTFGTGTWSIVTGPGTITTPSAPNSTITGLIPGQTTICRWSISNGPCTASFDDVNVVCQNGPTIADAGPNHVACTGTTILAGNTPTSGIGTWSLISGAGTIVNPNAPNSTITGLGIGNNVFQWSISVGGTCPPTTDLVTITHNAPVTATISSFNQVSCFGAADGQATVTPGGGNGSYSYNWAPSGGTNATASGLSGGNYMVTVTDGNLCTATATATIVEPAVLSLGMVSTDPTCYGDPTGGIDLTVNGGTPGYNYSWSNSQTTQDISGVQAGSYTVTVTDAEGCSQSASTLLINPTAISIAPTVTPISCNGDADGAIDLNVLGGAGGFSYAWSNGDTTDNIDSLSNGNYTVTVTDADGCTSSSTIAVNDPALLDLTATVTDATSGNNGGVNLTVSGGTPSYTYSWSNGMGTEDLASLAPGSYTVTVTDANGCTSSLSVTVNSTSGIHETTDAGDISIYPNPNSGKFFISITNQDYSEFVISMIDISGKEILRINEQKTTDVYTHEIDILNQPAGIYLLQIRYKNGQIFTKRLIKK